MFGASSRISRKIVKRTIHVTKWNRFAQPTIRLNHHVASDVSKVEKIILDNIKATGPLPFATYMQLCLSHPTHGYYMNPEHSVFGTSGDFITSPEISQVFGELIGIWFVSQYVNAGKPPSVRLVELGPGRGTLMADILRTVSKFGLSQALTGVHLVETSQALRSIQEQRLQDSPHHGPVKLHWYNSLTEIPRNPSEYTILIAHEFFDALPVHILQKMETGWHEVLIASNEEAPSADPAQSQSLEVRSLTPRLRRVLSPKPSAASILLGHSSARFDKLPTGSLVEVSPTSFRIAHQIGRLLASDIPSEAPAPSEQGLGGCGLIIDYGSNKVFGDSFRAFKQHKIVDPFHLPGECDLTANVDFAYLKEAMAGLVEAHGPISQADFLDRMGLELRVEGLVKAAKSEERKTVLQAAANRLVDRNGMGKEYQVLGITSSGVKDVWPFIKEADVQVDTQSS